MWYYFFLVLQKQKRKIFVWCEEKTGRQILLILFCANTIALGLFWLDRQEKDSGEIERNVYGGGSRRETYEITIGQTLKEKRSYDRCGRTKVYITGDQKNFQTSDGENG